MSDDSSDKTHVDIQVTAKKDELSLKAKGAGLLVLISICLIGIIILALQMANENANPVITMPVMILSYIAYSLIATLDATLGLTVRHHD